MGDRRISKQHCVRASNRNLQSNRKGGRCSASERDATAGVGNEVGFPHLAPAVLSASAKRPEPTRFWCIMPKQPNGTPGKKPSAPSVNVRRGDFQRLVEILKSRKPRRDDKARPGRSKASPGEAGVSTSCSIGHAGREKRPTLSSGQILILRLLLAVG